MKQMLLLLILVISTMAATVYVKDDQFKIVLRARPMTAGRFVDELPTGVALKVLAGPKNGWTQVKVLETGKVGWVISNFTMRREPWEKQFTELKASNDTLQKKFNSLEEDYELKKADYKTLDSTLIETKEELKKAKTTIEIQTSKSIKVWFLIGAAVMLLGWIMAHISLPSKGKKKKRW